MIKLLKQLFPFIFASILLPQNKTKNKCKIQQLFSNVLIPTTTTTTTKNHPNINNQPQIN